MKKLLFIFGISVLLFACNKKDDPPEPPVPDDPVAVNLVFPFKDTECNIGTDVSATESSVAFEWEASLYTHEYEISVRDLISNQIQTFTTTGLEHSFVLLRGTPYEWFVISHSNEVATTAQSEVWRFYNAGDAIQSYVPFPAEIVFPLMSEIVTTGATDITLDWNGVDLDNDITGYDVYFGTNNPPASYQTNVQNMELNVPVSSATIYYWYIITNDAKGNISDSGIFQFKMN